MSIHKRIMVQHVRNLIFFYGWLPKPLGMNLLSPKGVLDQTVKNALKTNYTITVNL